MVGVTQRAKNRLLLLAVNDRGYVVGEQHHRAKITDHEVDLVLALRADGMSQKLVAEKLEISRRTVRDIESGKTRAQVPTGWADKPRRGR